MSIKKGAAIKKTIGRKAGTHGPTAEGTAPLSSGQRTDSTPKPRIQPGSMKGIVLRIADDFDAPLDEFKEYQ